MAWIPHGKGWIFFHRWHTKSYRHVIVYINETGNAQLKKVDTAVV